MIAVEARGRLGNQMFQFAFGLAASARLGTDFAMSDALLRTHFRLDPWSAPLRTARRAFRYRARRWLSPFPVTKVAGDAEPDSVLASLVDGTHYDGFFQSERYFAGADNLVRRAFEPHAAHLAAFRARYGDLIRSPYVCCHVRHTDYAQWLGGVALPLSYYRDSLRQAGVAAETPVVFVGDDLAEVEEEFGGRPGVHLEHNAEIFDLLLLKHAGTVVTSNSSFGWWGAWLGGPGRRVFAPRHWLGFRGDHDIPRAVVPPRWTEVAVAAARTATS